MRKLILFICLSSLLSCNAIKTITGGETKLGDGSAVHQPPPYNSLPDGLMSFWRMEEAASQTRLDSTGVRDLSDFSSGGIPSAAGAHGNSADCGNATPISSALLETSSGFTRAIGEDFAIGFWAYLPDNLFGGCSDTNTVIRTSDFYVMFENVDCENDLSDIQVSLGGSIVDFLDAVDFSGGAWHHFALNIDHTAGNVELFVDGTSLQSAGYSPVALSSSYLDVCSNNTGFEVLGGLLDSLGIWGRRLTPEEIGILYSGGSGLD